MGSTKQKLKRNEPALGGWIMIGHPVVSALMASEGFDWIGVDLEHTATSLQDLSAITLEASSRGCDVLARLDSCDPVQAQKALDTGCTGIIVPLINTAEEAKRAVMMAKFPPDGNRGAAFSRASDFGRNFTGYYKSHNESVVVAIMMEHIKAVENADAILSTPGIDAVFVGPYDLSASIGRAGELDHPEVQLALQKILAACKRHGVAAGIHVVRGTNIDVRERIDQGYRFIACSIDTEFVIQGCRRILGKSDPDSH
jgi:2-dehydro-3-deoxyglucarate aldolase